MHVAGLAADERLIDFNVAADFPARRILHRQPDTVEHEPRGLLRDAKGAVDFPRADAVLAVGDHPHARKPLIQPKRGIFKDGPGLERELPLRVLRLANPTHAGLVEVDAFAAASGAGDAIRPAASHQIVKAVHWDGKELHGFNQGAGVAHG